MGCKPSKLQIQRNGDLFKEDTEVRKRFLTGLQASKGADGLEGNFQIVFAKTKRKRYHEKVVTFRHNNKLPKLLRSNSYDDYIFF